MCFLYSYSQNEPKSEPSGAYKSGAYKKKSVSYTIVL